MDDEMKRKPLIEYLPDFMRQFAEIKEIMKASQIEADAADLSMQKILDNSFILDCDEWGIKKYENILGITPSSEDTLDSRKSRVLVRWNDKVPYTYRVLIRKLNELCGVKNYDISGCLKKYELTIAVRFSVNSQIKCLEEMLDRILPMNMSVATVNHLKYELEEKATLAGAVLKKTTVTISAGMDKVIELKSKLINGSVITSRIWRSVN